VKEKDAGLPLEPIAEKMNELARQYLENSQPDFCARHGMVDEIVKLKELRNYLKAFSGAAYQNPKSICPKHQMILPRIIKG
jgi:glutaconyl-CoA decarboxylase